MICKNCNTENIIKAKFCQHCGSAFTDEQREEAYDRTIFGMIDKLEGLYHLGSYHWPSCIQDLDTGGDPDMGIIAWPHQRQPDVDPGK